MFLRVRVRVRMRMRVGGREGVCCRRRRRLEARVARGGGGGEGGPGVDGGERGSHAAREHEHAAHGVQRRVVKRGRGVERAHRRDLEEPSDCHDFRFQLCPGEATILYNNENSFLRAVRSHCVSDGSHPNACRGSLCRLFRTRAVAGAGPGHQRAKLRRRCAEYAFEILRVHLQGSSVGSSESSRRAFFDYWK